MDHFTRATALFDKHADGYAAKFMDVAMYQAALDTFCRAVSQPGAEVLDIACGPGNVTKYLLQQRPDFRITGIDSAPQMLALAQKHNPSAHFIQMDCRRIDTLEQRYAALVCSFFLPYLSQSETEQLLHDCAALLETNGVLYLSTIEDEHENSRWETSSTGDQLFMHYYTGDYLTQVLSANGLSLLHINRVCYPGRDGATVTDILLIAQKLNHPSNTIG